MYCALKWYSGQQEEELIGCSVRGFAFPQSEAVVSRLIVLEGDGLKINSKRFMGQHSYF